MRMTRILTSIRGGVALAALLMSSVALADEVKPPLTATEHQALATSYEGKAAELRADAKQHRAQAKAHVKEWPKLKGETNPHAKRLEAESLAQATEAEKRAAEADRAAEFHKLRASELAER